jgi:opacity protein-like surface antigen
MKKLLMAAAMTVAALSAAALAPAVSAGTAATANRAANQTASQAAYCGITWGSLAKQDRALTTAPITNLRAGRHQCFDRLVVDLGPRQVAGSGQRAGYHVRYVSQVTQDGSGAPVPVAGGARLQVTVNAPAHDLSYRPTYRPANPARAVNVSGFSTFRQVAFAGTFEGYTTIGLGVRARLPFRVLLLAGPGSGSRLVIDVAHRW